MPVLASAEEALHVADHLARRFAPGASARDAERALPRAEVAELAASGLLGVTVPRSHGGAGVGARTLGEVFVRLAAADSSIGQVPQNHFFFVDVLAHAADAAQQQHFYAEVLAGRHFGNALSERGSRDASAYDIAFAPVGDGTGDRVLDGVKHYATGSPFAPWIPVYATDPDAPTGEQLLAAWVAADSPGVEVVDDWAGMGQRTTGSGTVRFTGVHVPARCIVPAWRIFSGPEVFGAAGNYLHAAIDVGIALAALAEGRRLVHEVARPWAEFGATTAAGDPMVVQDFGELALRVRAARALLHDAGDAIDAARAALGAASAAEASVAVAAARAAADTAAVSVASDVFALVGSRAAGSALNLHRYWRDARTHTLHDPRRAKIRHLGDHALNDVAPPSNGWV